MLFPNPSIGLAIIWLYERIENGTYPDKTFKEADLHTALQAVNIEPRNEHGSSRHPWERYNSIIADLQEYFLRYDEEKQVYKFKEYANEFCKHAYQTLKSNFDPTQIEKICFSLRERLENRRNTNEILDWFQIDFDSFKPQLRQQIDFLDRQIDHSVIELRQNKQLNLREGDIIETLKQIDARFDSIRNQNKELRSAFREIELIKKKLEDYSNIYDSNTIGNYTYDAVSFFYEMRQTLSSIDKRLDRIQPKIKQLFSNLNKPLFNSRVEKFLFYLIDKSEDKVIGNKRTLHLPCGIPSPILWESWMNFTIVERRTDLFPVKAKKRFTVTENIESKTKLFLPFTEKLVQHEEIARWIDHIVNEVEVCNEVLFSPYFFKILANEEGKNLSLAIGVTCRALKFFEESSSYSIAIHPEKPISNHNKSVSIWEMTIQKK